MENTNKNKEKFFAQYYGQKIAQVLEYTDLFVYEVGVTAEIREIDSIKLKPLSRINDDLAIEIAVKCAVTISNDLFIHDYENLSEWKNVLMFLDTEQNCFSSKLFDVLRSEGFALSWMGITIEEQIEYGWIKLTENN